MINTQAGPGEVANLWLTGEARFQKEPEAKTFARKDSPLLPGNSRAPDALHLNYHLAAEVRLRCGAPAGPPPFGGARAIAQHLQVGVPARGAGAGALSYGRDLWASS